MKVTFRCKASGNTCSFTNEYDIEHMRKEAHYEEVKDGLQIQEQEATTQPEQTIQEQKVKARGRPKMVI